MPIERLKGLLTNGSCQNSSGVLASNNGFFTDGREHRNNNISLAFFQFFLHLSRQLFVGGYTQIITNVTFVIHQRHESIVGDVDQL